MTLKALFRGHKFLQGESEWHEGLHAIIGPSGSGKTTLLRLLAGLGESTPYIDLNHNVWQDGKKHSPAYHRPICYVPQHPSLIPFRTIRQQVQWVMAESFEPAVLAHWADRLEILSLLDRYPQSLSGGQQQRAAVLRALATRQPVLLLDEALSQVEERIRRQCLQWFRNEPPVPWIFYSTHQLQEALAFSDTITVIVDGQVYSPLSPDQLLKHPPTAQIAWMLGYRGSFRLDDNRHVLLHPARILIGAYPEQGLVLTARVDIYPQEYSLRSHWIIKRHQPYCEQWEWDLPQYPAILHADAITLIDPPYVSYELSPQEVLTNVSSIAW
ncbi:ATP-binding cassette domain-containing protein [Sulfobacillus thermosulfidooxidans]|uniref:ATP-binding cassette domain-containing protein n=1 Tax=Sulfobacillus thermosulfidooxidans TaxID=28034 RepID=UPI0006B52A83|nr:ATP-binding cassette domain-containing protein [Sulfobacillus thermosulfidooxidans]